MNTDIDFKALWNNGAKGEIPDAKEIFAKGASLQKRARNKMLICNFMLAVTVVLISCVWIVCKPQMMTTKIGIVLIISAITFYMMASMGYINLLYKNNMGISTSDYLQHLLFIKQKQENMNVMVANIYFVLLSAGLFLYMIEYALMGGIVFRVAAYGITFSFMAFNWFYIHPKVIKKQRDKLNGVIEKLEEINRQLTAD